MVLKRARAAARGVIGADSTSASARILQALLSGRPNALRETLASLPVKMVLTPSRDALGRLGSRREFFVDGVLRIRTFDVGSSGGTLAPNETLLVGAEDTEGGIDLTPSAAATGVPTFDYCEYESEIVGFTSGDCATQEDIDDYLASLAILEAEYEATETTVNNTISDYCLWHQEDVDVCADQASATREVLESDGSDARADATYVAAAGFRCGFEKAGAVVGLITYAAGLVALTNVATGITVMALLGGLLWFGAGIGALGLAAVALYMCLNAEEATVSATGLPETGAMVIRRTSLIHPA